MIGLAAKFSVLLLALASLPGEGESPVASDAPPAGPVSKAPVASPASRGGTLAAYQARVEATITIRVRPRKGSSRVLSSLPTAPMSRKMEAIPISKCLPSSQLAGVQVTRNNSLLLFMRDQRIVLASLEKACRARDYYSGFYMAPSEDGQICVQRDVLQSRTGAKCKVDSWQGLVPAEPRS